ncbi:MAG: cell division topological specificity factor MinE [Salipiger thiooxidans]|jgi:cell division topological specificity factor|uniref:Cell division topological specificity factor n=1 Tax=Salipiger thiooxidans TaxID=282683 RepID=A0A1G7AIK4_9RHOB|nr:MULTISPECIES: cell division topological specificity factor MinE [Salipiger]EEX15663.1 cell division topological specificity factor MinE [Citreicella sp. SE45]NVK61859.1 cell division topological specificity factor MinE [Paracoccaceae bacterium]MBN8185716.1 cell division topological specificity factor MinE [Salipiger thiooxidans]MCA0845940.1 cell division topological specificity factor MinE [Salipiger thiooxidans]SDE14560.1 cell division topological specificity factor MinE [Salipiger thiooxi
MSLFGFSLKARRPKSAQTAKDRLQLLLAHERSAGSETPDYLPQLQYDLIAVIRKYMNVSDDDVEIKMERDDDVSSLEINIEMPATSKARPAKR